MPSFDAGFYHLTSLIPLLAEGEDPGLWRWQPRSGSPAHSLRELLDSFRSIDVPDLSEEEAAAVPTARAVPFSRNRRTHFARLVVVDDLAYNGLQQPDTLIALLRGLLPGGQVPPQEQPDHLPCPYLLVLIDFDAADGERETVTRYLDELWQTMEQEWTLILRHCQGFAMEASQRQRSFVELILTHEIESTFSFSAYGVAAEQARRWQAATGRFLPPSRSNRIAPLLPPLLWAALLLLGLLTAAWLLVRWLLGLPALACGRLCAPWDWISRLQPDPALLHALALVLLSLGALTLVAPLLWQGLLRQANRPWPAQPGTDLRAVLKALELQRRFLTFAETWQHRQTDDEGSLRQRFREFLEESQPRNPEGPSLRPGQIPAIRPCRPS